MGYLWSFALLLITFGRICAQGVTDINVIDTNTKFDIEWKSSNENITAYFLEACRSVSLLNETITDPCYSKLVRRVDNQEQYTAMIGRMYFPSSTYVITISSCSNTTEDLPFKTKCDSDGICITSNNTICKLPTPTFHHTPPIKPVINLKNNTKCDDNICEIVMNVTDIQKSNSSLYVFELKSGSTEITMDFVKNITKMKNTKIEWNNPHNIRETIKRTMCNNTIILLLVNDYMGHLNFTSMNLANYTTKADCEKRSLLRDNSETAGTNYYYLIIIPIVLVIIGIIIGIKRKVFFGFFKKITSNRPEIIIEPTTIIPLVRKNSMKILQKFNYKIPSHVLTREGLQLYLRNNPEKITHNLDTEFKNVGEDASQKSYGELFEDKNRYKNILPYEETRVKLNLLKDKFNSHYINASYIKGYNNDKKYIATQGPTAKTLGDFWRMVWQEKVTLIIMLTNTKENGRKKCEQYWPDKADKLYEDYTVTLQSVHKYFEYTKREFSLAHMNLERNVTQLHFTIWPDKGIPQTPYSLVKFLKAARGYQNFGPILVHCSAGIGRTGTFILCDYVIDMLDEGGKADFPQALHALRKCRRNLVQYIAQYLYSHCVINEYLHTKLHDINKDEFKEDNMSETNVEEILGNIQNCDFWLNILSPARVHHGYDQNKNKHRNDTPLNSTGFISLQRYPNHDKESYYIDAVEILSEAGNIISTSQPLPNTLSAFWRLVLEKNITVVLSLHELDFEDETSIKFWPTTEESLNPVDFITLTLIEHTSGEAYDTMRIKLEDSKNEEPQFVYILHFKNWKRNSLPEIDEFLAFHKGFAELSRKQPVLVACYDAADASSVFITFLYLLDLLNWNLTIDVTTAISTLKIYRKNFNLDAVKLKFIYDVMQVYLQNVGEDFHKDTNAPYENLKIDL